MLAKLKYFRYPRNPLGIPDHFVRQRGQQAHRFESNEQITFLMERVMTRLKLGSKFLVVVVIAAMAGSSYAQDAIHALTGTVTKVDKTAKTMAVKTTDGAEEVFKYTERTAIRESHAGAKA